MIGDHIRELREKRAWTQAHLAEAAGVSLRTIQRLESIHSCSAETLLALASALEVDVRELTRDDRLEILGDSARPQWHGLRPRAAAAWGAGLAAPSLTFVGVNLLKSGLGVAAPYDRLAGLGAALGLQTAFDALSPMLFLGGPLAALALILAATFRPRVRPEAHGLSLVALDMRLDPLALMVMAAALASVAALGLYLVGENLADLARGRL